MLRFLTAGESHGKALVVIIDNYPSGVKIEEDFINNKLKLRQSGYGRGARQKIEADCIEFLSGVRGGYTTGSPISFIIKNKDYENWTERMDTFKPVDEKNKIHVPRPGHADFAGYLKYNLDDIRNVLERSSARETASRVAVGAICQLLLADFGIEFSSAVTAIGEVSGLSYFDSEGMNINLFDANIIKNIKNSELRMPFPELEEKAKRLIDDIKKDLNTIGGTFEIHVKNVPIGLGSYTQWDEKLDAHIAMSCMSIQAIKSVEIGLGVKSAYIKGSNYQDSIFYDAKNKKYFRKTDNAGGIEGGMSNGEIIVVRCAMKPIPTLMKPYLDTIDIKTKAGAKAFLERSDICAVPAASVVGESAVAYSVLYFFLKKFGGDSLSEIRRNYEGYVGRIS
jgi:chorismate synthase